LLRLPYEVKAMFRDWLAVHAPLKAERVMAVLNAARGGRDNDPRFGQRMRGEGAYAQLLQQRFAVAVRRHGLNSTHHELRCDLFVPPARPATFTPQMPLF
jgi:DNA repair photolyase